MPHRITRDIAVCANRCHGTPASAIPSFASFRSKGRGAGRWMPPCLRQVYPRDLHNSATFPSQGGAKEEGGEETTKRDEADYFCVCVMSTTFSPMKDSCRSEVLEVASDRKHTPHERKKRTADRRQQTADSRQQTADSR
jgi:hypothetical protein